MLLEVLVALVIFTACGAALTALGLAATVAVQRSGESERSFRNINALLNAVALWDVADLDRHLGERREGNGMLAVQRVRPDLYEVELRDTTGRHSTILQTFLFRERH